MSWYKEGSVNIEQGSKTVTGIGTKWTNPLIGVCTGQMLILKTANAIEIYEIASVQSDTQLTLANQYSGTTKTGVSYEIPTAPNVSIEALALRISEMLNYYQQQMNGWQLILTGTGDITLTAPDGRVVTIKSQRALTETIDKVTDSQKTLTETVNNTIKKSGETNQSISGSLNVDELTENGVRVYSPNNKPTADDIGALAAVKLGNIYNVTSQINFNSNPKIAGIEPIYIVESYKNGDSWYNVYSNGFIEQSGIISAKTPTSGTVCATTVNLLKPMKTQYYSVSIDKINNGFWGDIHYSQARRSLTDFSIASFSSIGNVEALVRWTVRGY